MAPRTVSAHPHLNPERVLRMSIPLVGCAKSKALRTVPGTLNYTQEQLTRTCPDMDAAFATDVVKTLSAEDPTFATVTVVTSATEWNRTELHSRERKNTKGKDPRSFTVPHMSVRTPPRHVNTSADVQLTSLIQSKVLASPRKRGIYPSPPKLFTCGQRFTIPSHSHFSTAFLPLQRSCKSQAWDTSLTTKTSQTLVLPHPSPLS